MSWSGQGAGPRAKVGGGGVLLKLESWQLRRGPWLCPALRSQLHGGGWAPAVCASAGVVRLPICRPSCSFQDPSLSWPRPLTRWGLLGAPRVPRAAGALRHSAAGCFLVSQPAGRGVCNVCLRCPAGQTGWVEEVGECGLAAPHPSAGRLGRLCFWAPAVWREVSAAGGGLSVAWRLLHKQQ